MIRFMMFFFILLPLVAAMQSAPAEPTAEPTPGEPTAAAAQRAPGQAPVLTEAHCITAKVIVNLSFDHIYYRDTGLLDLNEFAPIEVAVALIYCDQRTCAGRHKDCDCRCCLSVLVEGVAECFECRKY